MFEKKATGSIISFTYDGTAWFYNGYQTGTGGGTAEQVNTDWTATTGVESILHKPTEFNPTNHASTSSTYGIATGVNYGHTKLSDAITSTASAEDGIAATPWAVNSAKQYVLNYAVPSTRQINGHALNNDIQLDYTDVGAASVAAVPSITQVLSDGVNIADVNVGNNTIHIYAPTGTAQVPADWNASTGVSAILNKPNIPQITSILDTGVNIADVTIGTNTIHLYAPAGGDGGVTQIPADWEASAGVNSILHKPAIPSVAEDIAFQPSDQNFDTALNHHQDVGTALDVLWETVDNISYENVDWEADSGTTSILNKPTVFNPTNHASTESTYGVASYYNYGHVKLTDYLYGTESVEDGFAATPCAVSKIFDSIYATANYSSGAYLGSITINGNATDFFSPSGAAPIILSSFSSLDEDALLNIYVNFTNGIPVKVRQNVTTIDEETIDYLDLVDVSGNNGDGVPSYLTFAGTTSTQIHQIYYDDTASSLMKWTSSYTQIPAVPTATAAVSSGDRLLVQTVISAASSTNGEPVLDSSDTYEIKTTSIEFGNSTTQFLANDGQWRTPAGGGGGSAGGTANYTNGILEIVFYNS